jgi:hypothetical protein
VTWQSCTCYQIQISAEFQNCRNGYFLSFSRLLFENQLNSIADLLWPPFLGKRTAFFLFLHQSEKAKKRLTRLSNYGKPEGLLGLPGFLILAPLKQQTISLWTRVNQPSFLRKWFSPKYSVIYLYILSWLFSFAYKAGVLPQISIGSLSPASSIVLSWHSLRQIGHI